MGLRTRDLLTYLLIFVRHENFENFLERFRLPFSYGIIFGHGETATLDHSRHLRNNVELV
jgi:hypothetical protein